MIGFRSFVVACRVAAPPLYWPSVPLKSTRLWAALEKCARHAHEFEKVPKKLERQIGKFLASSENFMITQREDILRTCAQFIRKSAAISSGGGKLGQLEAEADGDKLSQCATLSWRTSARCA